MRRKPRNLEITFTDKAQTHFGGIYFFQEFVALLHLRHHLTHALRDVRVRTHYSVAQCILAILYPVILGLTRIEAAYFLRSNGIFQYLTGLPRFPDPTTLRRFLYEASPALRERLGRLTDRLTAALLQHPHARSRLLLDLDSTPLLVYGDYEGAQYAYTGKRRGVRSYEPLLAFEANSGLFWAGRQRPGGNPGAAEVVPLLEHSWAIMPTSIREVRVRGDANFYSDDTLTWLETHRAQYAVVARLTAPLKRRVTSVRYTAISEHWAVADFAYRAATWARSRRIVAVRKRITEDDPQPTLFTLGRYVYHAYVTNLDLSPVALWRFYNDRARLELLIKELKYDYGLGHIPTRRFDANALYFQILRLAYNLVVGFQTLCLPPRWQRATLATIRNEFFLLPAVLARPQGRPTLRFPRHLPARDDCEAVLKSLQTLRRHRDTIGF
jgi:hypothetical protein